MYQLFGRDEYMAKQKTTSKKETNMLSFHRSISLLYNYLFLQENISYGGRFSTSSLTLEARNPVFVCVGIVLDDTGGPRLHPLLDVGQLSHPPDKVGQLRMFV